jgi:hypothetical protein
MGLASITAGQILRDLIFIDVGDLSKVFRGQLAEVAMLDATRSGENHSAALVVGLDVLDQVISVKKSN